MRSYTMIRGGLGLAGLLVAVSLVGAVPAHAQTGGATPPGYTPPTTPQPPQNATTGVATLNADGSATAPVDAPPQVRKAINAANRIRFKPYLWGGGHGSFKAKGYDCSGAISYVLHAAGVLPRPLSSGPFMRWGAPGPGSWITVYANRGHMYAVIAGIRFDTSSGGDTLNQGRGPRWRSTTRAPGGYAVRHYEGL